MRVMAVLAAAAVTGSVALGAHAVGWAGETICHAQNNVWSAYDPNESAPLAYRCYTFDSIVQKRPVRAW